MLGCAVAAARVAAVPPPPTPAPPGAPVLGGEVEPWSGTWAATASWRRAAPAARPRRAQAGAAHRRGAGSPPTCRSPGATCGPETPTSGGHRPRRRRSRSAGAPSTSACAPTSPRGRHRDPAGTARSTATTTPAPPRLRPPGLQVLALRPQLRGGVVALGLGLGLGVGHGHQLANDPGKIGVRVLASLRAAVHSTPLSRSRAAFTWLGLATRTILLSTWRREARTEAV